jgi:hypothetical protein
VTAPRPARIPLVPVVLLLIASVGAQTPDQTNASPAEPLEQARRELEAAKGIRIKEGETGLRDLRSAVPSVPLQASPSVPLAAPRSEIRSSLEKPGRNWLVDAMEKKNGVASRKDEEKAERAGREPLRDGLIADPEAREREAPAGDNARDPGNEEREGGTGRKRGPEMNPFARFMKDWVSPQDFALLQSTLTSPREAGSAKPADYVSAQASDISSAVSVGRQDDKGLTSLWSGRPTGVEDASGRGRTRENPFLQFLPGDVPTSRGGAPATVFPGPVAPVLAPPPSVGAPALPPNPRGPVPDFVRPIADDKLYRQLKRF